MMYSEKKRLSSSVFNWVFYLYRSWIIYFHSVYLFWWAIYLENGIPFECITSEILGKNHLQLTKSIEKETDQVQCKQQQQQQQQNNMVDASISWFPCNWSKYPMPPLQTTHTHMLFVSQCHYSKSELLDCRTEGSSTTSYNISPVLMWPPLPFKMMRKKNDWLTPAPYHQAYHYWCNDDVRSNAIRIVHHHWASATNIPAHHM